MKRVLVIGCCGAGKSTFAKKLRLILNLPLYHLDSIFWLPNWVEKEKHKFDEELNHILSGDEWIIDGMYKRTLENRLKRADCVFFLNFPTHICIFRILKRVFAPSRARTDINPECNERFSWSFLKQAYYFQKKIRPEIMETLAKFPNIDCITFQSDKEMKSWLNRHEQN